MKKTLLSALILILAACLSPSGDQPAPQVTVTPEVTITPSAPILTPTPVPVDGVATIDGVLYVFDEAAQEWVALPELEGEFERVVVTEDERVVALDASDVEIYELSATGEWMMAVPEQWREFAAGLPEGSRMDAEAGRVYDKLNNVLYVLDAETKVWREPIRLEYSANFPAVWHEQFEGNVEGYDFSIPITIGLTNEVVKHPTHPILGVGMTQKGADAAAWEIAHAFWGRYRDLMGNKDVTFAEYMELVKQGEGQVEVYVLGENGKTWRTMLVDPRQGVSLVLTNKEHMPVADNSMWGFFLGVDETGKLLFATNQHKLLPDPKFYDPGWKELDRTFVFYSINDLAAALGRTPNDCMQGGDVHGKCGFLSMPDDFRDIWAGSILEGFRQSREGESDDVLFTLKR